MCDWEWMFSIQDYDFILSKSKSAIGLENVPVACPCQCFRTDFYLEFEEVLLFFEDSEVQKFRNVIKRVQGDFLGRWLKFSEFCGKK